MTKKTHGVAIALSVALFSGAFPALAQRVTGSFGAFTSPNDNIVITFTCTGLPTCSGQFTLVERIPSCSNTIVENNSFTATGLNLSQSGTISGSVSLGGADVTYTRQADGTCVMAPNGTTAVIPYSGVWNSATKLATITVQGDEQFTGTLTADLTAPPPVFPMVVEAQINAQTATATANIQFRPQDVGQTGGIFVFASAPAPRVQGGLAANTVKLGKAAGPKADAPQCVLAQLSPQGQLTAVTTSQLQAFFTGTLSAAGSSVSILNNTPTPNVAGSTFYVGYGGSGSGMLNSGIFRNAVLVPGDSVCPMLPYTTALWLQPSEAGWGLNVVQQGSVAFATLFTYDAARQPLWLLMSGGVLQPDGLTFSGDLYRTTGPAFSANPFTPINSANYTRVGTMAITVSDANSGQLRYTVNGAEVQKSIQRYTFGSRAANCLPSADSRVASNNYTDLWWKADESGWGLNITHQDNILFGTLFTYAAGAGSANPGLWLVMSNGNRQPDGSFLGELRRTTGPAFNAVPFTPITAADQTVVGTMRLRFSDGNNGTLEYSVNGTNVTKPITRIPFSLPVAACN